MVGSQPTLLDVLDPQQFRLAALLAIGLEDANVAYVLDVSEPDFKVMLEEILHRTGCHTAENLAVRLLFEYRNDLIEPKRLQVQLAELTKRASELLRDLPTSAGEYVEL